MEEVTLLQLHTHQGRAIAVGECITVTQDEAEWLRAQQIIAPLPPAPSSPSVGKDKVKPENNHVES
ncbi:Uncharacterised protein [Yersinia aldovae]|uniref:DUF7210 family protein n=1 Tax=Yersinia aldovae TaxID=29483 RepID=UPI0005E80225|nr:hypothetical protein [Yersinia aldovae]CNJ03362.1 Uncharacterised protein [Yersinia aldovae]